jgi:hypothetical protein
MRPLSVGAPPHSRSKRPLLPEVGDSIRVKGVEEGRIVQSALSGDQLNLEQRPEVVVGLEVGQQIRKAGVPLGQLADQAGAFARRCAEVAEEIAAKLGRDARGIRHPDYFTRSRNTSPRILRLTPERI